MREIKFRAWDGVAGCFYYFTIGNTLSGSVGLYDELCVNGCPFEQFTGQKDKDETEIYEGDIIGTPDGRCGVVECIDGRFFYDDKRDMRFDAWGFPYRYEVIGNIHENPELIR